MELNVKLTILSIIRTEQILNKPFSDLDYKSEDDLTALLYCCLLCSNEEAFTLETFKSMCKNGKFLSRLMKNFEKESKCLTQFQEKQEKGNGNSAVEEPYIRDIVASLIVDAGIDAEYLLNKASIYDIPMYTKAYDKKVKQDMEKSRFWTYLNIMPHIDTKKCKSPQDMFPFDWEKEAIRIDLEKDAALREETLRKFMNGEIKI